MSSKHTRSPLCAFVLSVCIGSLLYNQVQADSTARGTITATLKVVESVEFSPVPAFTLDAAGVVNQNIGSVVITSNNSEGWLLKVSSINGSMLVSGGSQIAYSNVRAEGPDEANVVSSPIELNFKAEKSLLASRNGISCLEGCKIDLTADIESAQISGKQAGDYEDTLTFVFESN